VSARQQSTTTAADDHDDDDCLSISTSVTVVISRRPGPSNTSATPSDQTAADDSDARAVVTTGNQVVVSATIPAKVGAPSLPSQVEMATSCVAALTEKDERHADDSASPHVTADVTRSSAGSSRPPKRKSLESVIKSLQPTPVVTSPQPEVARSRPEVLVRPMQACAPNLRPVSTQAVRPIGQLSVLHSQPEAEVVDLRRPKRPAPSRSCVGRKPKSLSPLAAPPRVYDPYYGDKRRRFSSGLEAASARFGCYFPSPAALCGPAAVAAARYHACMATARPDMGRLPLYYGSVQQRAEPNGYDAPLELTTKPARDRK